jgi:hypothetical protein
MEREVHIQRASLSIALIRSGANAPEVRRDDAALFLKNLHRAINVCTHHDIKVSEDTWSVVKAVQRQANARQIDFVQLTSRASGLQRLHC